jgi:phage terminase large subunit
VARKVKFDYQPREQFLPFHQREQRWATMVAHRRAGKTVACVNDCVARAVYNQLKRPRYAYIAPYYSQAKKVAWEYLKEYTKDAAVKIREADLSVRLFNDAEIALYGADNPNSFRGQYFDGVILDEFADMRPSIWTSVLLPALSDRKGWAVFIGTPKGKNHFHTIYELAKSSPEWFSAMLRASETGLVDEAELEMQRQLMSEEEYLQEYECSFTAAVRGTYYAKLIAKMEANKQIRQVPWEEGFPVNVVMDIGYTDSTAIWFWQQRPDGVAIIDYEEDHMQPLEYYFALLEHKGYEYDTIWLPHDAKSKTLQTGRSTIEQFLDNENRFPGQPSIDIVPRLSIQDGIDAARLLLPTCYIDEDKCRDGIEALRAYRRKWNEIKQTFENKPEHNWASHGADGFRYLSLVAQRRIIQPDSDFRERFVMMETPEFCLEDLWSQTDPPRRSDRI